MVTRPRYGLSHFLFGTRFPSLLTRYGLRSKPDCIAGTTVQPSLRRIQGEALRVTCMRQRALFTAIRWRLVAWTLLILALILALLGTCIYLTLARSLTDQV